MHVQTDITTYDNRLWTRGELDAWARQHCKSSTLYLPGDELYAPIKHKKDLENQIDIIKKQLKLRKSVDLSVSENTPLPGLLTYYDKKLQLTLPTSLMGDALLAAACITHCLSHAVAITSKKLSVDQQENNHIADVIGIQSGLGIVLLNGLSKGGWHTLLHKSPVNATKALGYYSPAQASVYIREFIDKTHDNPKQVAKYIVPWQQKLLGYKASSSKLKPQATKEAARRHFASKRWFFWLFSSLIAVIFAAIFMLLNTTNILDSELQKRYKTATELKAAYTACIERVSKLSTQLPESQLSSERLLSFEQSRCVSLENQYNAAAKSYNRYLQGN